MKLLYIFPHPDDESFGPAAVIHQQLEQGHDVYLLTLTRGGATRQRLRLNLSVEEMGAIRFGEMMRVQQTLGLTGMTVWDLPDGELHTLDRDELVSMISRHILHIGPDVIVTYAEHGISGHPDHIVTHAAVVRCCALLKEQGEPGVQRLAFLTLAEGIDSGHGFQLSHSPEEDIDCVIDIRPEDTAAMKQALECYVTYQSTIQQSGIEHAYATRPAVFELYEENHKPPLHDLTSLLPYK